MLFLLVAVKDTLSQAYPFADRHSTSITDQWLSCSPSLNPNPVRGTGHWLRIDLGDIYALQSSKFWNFNTPERINSYENEPWSLNPLAGSLNDGIKEAYIDISDNGINWKEWGRFSIPKSNGSSFYEGVNGPNFAGITARYILISAISNHGGTCYGLGEIKINGTIATLSDTENQIADVQMEADPNPFSEYTTINFGKLPVKEGMLTILDANNREITRYPLIVTDGNVSINIETKNWPAGIYFARFTSEGGSKTIKLDLIR